MKPITSKSGKKKSRALSAVSISIAMALALFQACVSVQPAAENSSMQAAQNDSDSDLPEIVSMTSIPLHESEKNKEAGKHEQAAGNDVPECNYFAYSIYKKSIWIDTSRIDLKIDMPKVLAKPLVRKKEAGSKKPVSNRKQEKESYEKGDQKKKETASKTKSAFSNLDKKGYENKNSRSSEVASSSIDNPVYEREVIANPGDDIEISFSLDGWSFLGFSKPSDSKGITFQGKKTGGNQTFFHYKAASEGTYDLSFSRHDNNTGNESRESVRVVVQSASGVSANGDGETSETKTAEELYDAKMYKEALAKYLEKNEDSPNINDRIAELYKKTGDPEQAIKYWQKNTQARGDLADRAVLEIAKIHVEKKDTPGLNKFVNQLAGTEGIQGERHLALIARYLEKIGEYQNGISILDSYIGSHQDASNIDELYFILGMFYEKDTPFRDLRKSKACYMKVRDDFPESHLYDAASERIIYLDRYFFIIK